MDTYNYEEMYFGIPAPADGDYGWADEERRKADLIGRLFQRMLDAVGEGVIEGAEGSINGFGDLAISELTAALITDGLGAVPVTKQAVILAREEFVEGENYVHVQLGEEARTDGSCGYYISASATPAQDAIAICQVTMSGGVLSAVDNSIKAIPAVANRIPWEALKRSYNDAQTLLAFLDQSLGERYMEGLAPADVDVRLTALETGGDGEGGGGAIGPIYWFDLQRSAANAQTIAQYVLEMLAEHVEEHEHGGGEGGATEVLAPWDVDAVNQAIALLREVEMDNALGAEGQVDAVVVVWGVWGEGSHAGEDWIDRENSTWLPG